MGNEPMMMLLNYAGHLFRRRVGEMLEREGVSIGQPPILWHLEAHDGCIQRDLADHCHIKAASVSSVLSSMEQSGYIVRRTQKGDRRAQRVYLTELGRQKILLTNETFRRVENSCLEDLDEPTRALMRESLTRIINRLKPNPTEGTEDVNS